MLCGHEGRTIGHLGGTSWSPISLLGTFVSVVSSIAFLSFTCRIASPRGRGGGGRHSRTQIERRAIRVEVVSK